MIEDAALARRRAQPLSLLVAYALAWAGGSIAYVPFLTVLLPQRLTALAGAGDVRWLGIVATAGAVAASLGNIGWGFLSDRIGHRLRLSAIGIVAVAFASTLIAISDTPLGLVASVALWQVALNLLLAPLAAYAADHVPDVQKGLLGGLLAIGPAIAALSLVVLAVLPGGLNARLAMIVAITAAATAPLLVMGRHVRSGLAMTPTNHVTAKSRATLIHLWLARLSVQLAEGLLFLFLYYALRRLSGGHLSLTRYAVTAAVAQVIAIPVALIVGRWSDRTGRRRGPLLAMIAFVALGLLVMAGARSWTEAAIGYATFLIGSNSFLSLHSTFAMQQLPDRCHHGRDLGLFNLTNTLPSLISPLLAVWVIGTVGFSGLLAGLAAAMIIPALLVLKLDLA